MFCSFVVTQVASLVSGLLYDRKSTAVFVHATSYGIRYFRSENTRSGIFCFPRIVMIVMNVKYDCQYFFLMRMKAKVKNCRDNFTLREHDAT